MANGWPSSVQTTRLNGHDDHPEGGVRIAQPRTQLGGLRDGDAAVVHREHRIRFGDLSGHLFDDRRFLVSVQTILLAGSYGCPGSLENGALSIGL